MNYSASLSEGVAPLSRRLEQGLCVDKTDQICRLAAKKRKVLLVRPSGFGKSRLVTILAELFAGNRALFEKYKAKDLWRDKAYAVVRVDIGTLKKVASAEELQSRLNDKIIEWFSPVGFPNENAAQTMARFAQKYKVPSFSEK